MASGRPVPREVLFGEVNKRPGDIGVVRDKATVEVCKAEKGSNVFDFFRDRPASNSVQLDGVHGKLPGFDDHSKIFHFSGGKAAFL